MTLKCNNCSQECNVLYQNPISLNESIFTMRGVCLACYKEKQIVSDKVQSVLFGIFFVVFLVGCAIIALG